MPRKIFNAKMCMVLKKQNQASPIVQILRHKAFNVVFLAM